MNTILFVSMLQECAWTDWTFKGGRKSAGPYVFSVDFGDSGHCQRRRILWTHSSAPILASDDVESWTNILGSKNMFSEQRSLKMYRISPLAAMSVV